ncbi:MAG TPA: CocE/NonD family hydrolase [Candidatus Udaeobacter sp.]|nr:CocE/NonD family hydrolase [Candidatus Udaeobacter sp.]
MTTPTPRAIRHHETIWIPLADGTRLAGRLWIPEDAEAHPVPAILEYIPYRRRDGTRDGDDLTHPYLAAHGYACLRLDIRGTGDSDGVIRDEYLKQEQDDAVEAIAWLANQTWCTGNVGMMGISWGGFNSLQVAARRPPALKAIVTACSTDDRYADDMHYMGGCHMTGNLEWGSSFFSRMAQAPDPLIVGDRWREMWTERLEAVTPVFATWLRHQRRDSYWRHGSVCEDIGAIACAVMAIGGWADGYTNAVFRLLRNLKSPRLAIVGPWGHKYPHNGVPGPAIGFLTECLRWWDHWLKGQDNGIMAEPMLRAYVQDSVAPASHYDHRPGHWVAEQSWPSQANVAQRLALNPEGLAAKPGAILALSVCSPETTGAAAGEWCPYGLGGLGPELPTDQRPDDAYSLVFDGEPLAEALEILGAPVADLELEADRPVANVIVRLSDVAPDGRVTRVSYGVLNLTHRDGHSAPVPLKPNQRQRIRLQLNDIGHRFLAGHRIRVAVSTAYWPIIWPAPTPVRLTVWTGQSSLSLPVRRPRPEDARVHFADPEKATPTRRRMLQPGAVHRSICQDVASGEQRIEVLRDDGASVIEEIGVETALRKVIRYRMRPDDPTSARSEVEHEFTLRRPQNWDTRVHTHCAIACTESEFVVEADLEAFESGIRMFSRSWTERIPRDMC